MDDKHIIWSNINLDLNDWRDDLKEKHPYASEDELYQIMCETNNDYLDDERTNLNIQLPREIIVIADIGRWDGRYSGYRMIESGNIKDCLTSNYDCEWYVDKLGDFRCRAIHHDGTNHYLYRQIKSNISDERLENFQNKIYSGTATRADINRITKRLGDEIGKVYGWHFPTKQKTEVYER